MRRSGIHPDRPNDFFTLERSIDGQDWEKINIIQGNGTTLTGRSYSSIDYSPLPGRSYYRLKQTDFDGAYEYMPIGMLATTPYFCVGI